MRKSHIKITPAMYANVLFRFFGCSSTFKEKRASSSEFICVADIGARQAVRGAPRQIA